LKESVIANSFDKIKSFEVESSHENTTTVRDLLRSGKFNIKINNNPYSVYPDYTQLITHNCVDDKTDIFKGQNISMTKKHVLSHFIDIVKKINGNKDISNAEEFD